MPLTRIILDWTRPLCETVPEWLLDGATGLADLRDTTLVVPTRQSGWRLRGALPLAAEALGAALLSPAVVSAPVLLTPPATARTASELQSLLAWCAVLKAVPPGECDAFLGSRRTETASTGWALQTARRLQSLRGELADGGLTIADVAARGPAIVEGERWAAMADLESRYTAHLAAAGLEDATCAMLAYARTGDAPANLRHLVLACVPDPPRLLLQMLERWAASGLRVTVLTAADPAEAPEAAFDAWGCPRPDSWSPRLIDLDAADLHLLATPEDQACFVAARLGRALATAPTPADGTRPQIAIGAADGETIAPLQRELAGQGLAAFNPQNRPFADTRLFRLLEALLDFGRHAGYAETAALLRHPDVLAALGPDASLLRDLDREQADSLPVTLDDLLARARSPKLAGALRQCRAWRESLRADGPSSALRQILQSVFARRQLVDGDPDDDAFRQGAELLDTALRELEAAAGSGHGDDAADALLARLQGASLKPERRDEDLDLEGWLELAWNPAPLLFVTGMNEGLVPDGRMSDVFLPDTLRRTLNLRDDRLRMARDAYLLTALMAQRRAQGRVVLLAGRTSLSGDPLRPSRLLFRCADDRLVERVTALYRDVPPSRNAAAFSISFRLQPAQVPPAAVSRKVLDHLSPTVFRDYLACPLRFYLRRVLGMEARDDLAREPDARAFGTLVHEVLNAMAAHPEQPWAWDDARRLAQWLEDQLRRRVTAAYGPHPWLGVVLAREAAIRRLQALADRQVAWHAAGWSIEPAQAEQDKQVVLDGMPVRGRIDRIDRHTDGTLCVLDYKTSERADAPAATHLRTARDDDPLPEAVVKAALLPPVKGKPATRDRRWIDLQLPLYVEMLRVEGHPRIIPGYVCLGAAQGDTGFKPWADYTDTLHTSAMACATAVIRKIRAGCFAPAGDGRGIDDFEGLLLGDPEATMARPPAWGGP